MRITPLFPSAEPASPSPCSSVTRGLDARTGRSGGPAFSWHPPQLHPLVQSSFLEHLPWVGEGRDREGKPAGFSGWGEEGLGERVKSRGETFLGRSWTPGTEGGWTTAEPGEGGYSSIPGHGEGFGTCRAVINDNAWRLGDRGREAAGWVEVRPWAGNPGFERGPGGKGRKAEPRPHSARADHGTVPQLAARGAQGAGAGLAGRRVVRSHQPRPLAAR